MIGAILDAVMTCYLLFALYWFGVFRGRGHDVDASIVAAVFWPATIRVQPADDRDLYEGFTKLGETEPDTDSWEEVTDHGRDQ